VTVLHFLTICRRRHHQIRATARVAEKFCAPFVFLDVVGGRRRRWWRDVGGAIYRHATAFQVAATATTEHGQGICSLEYIERKNFQFNTLVL